MNVRPALCGTFDKLMGDISYGKEFLGDFMRVHKYPKSGSIGLIMFGI